VAFSCRRIAYSQELIETAAHNWAVVIAKCPAQVANPSFLRHSDGSIIWILRICKATDQLLSTLTASLKTHNMWQGMNWRMHYSLKWVRYITPNIVSMQRIITRWLTDYIVAHRSMIFDFRQETMYVYSQSMRWSVVTVGISTPPSEPDASDSAVARAESFVDDAGERRKMLNSDVWLPPFPSRFFFFEFSEPWSILLILTVLPKQKQRL